MIDKEELIESFEKALAVSKAIESGFVYLTVGEAKTAFELLKEKEDIQCWIYPTNIYGMMKCPHCKSYWNYDPTRNKFFIHCPKCGKRVKWDDD